MRQLVKGAKPDWLNDHADAETAKYVAAPPEKRPSPWRAPEVVAALRLECEAKCMYCESLIDHVSCAAVERIRPKSRFAEDVLSWANLGLVCTRCNTLKGDYWHDEVSSRILNPYEDQLDQHIQFNGPLTVARLSSSQGNLTVKKLNLHRAPLVMVRLKLIDSLDALIRLWEREADPERKLVCAEEVERALTNDCEHVAVLRAYAASIGYAPAS